MRAVAYYRVSTDRQAGEDRNSLDAQRDAFRARCALKGYEAVGEYQDVESGRRVARPEYQRMLTAARADAFDLIVVTFLDRFGRDQWEIMARLGELRGLGVEVDPVYEDAREFITVALSAWKADQESKRIGERVRIASERAVRAGRPLGAYPYGYRRWRSAEGWGIAIEPDEAAVVRSIFRWYVTEALSMAQIRTRLNVQGTRAPRGPRWSAESVAGVLRRRTYLGDFTYGPTTVVGMVPPIIDRETFEAAERRRALRRGMNAPRSHRSDYLLSGIVYCGHCGGRLEGNTTSPRGYGPYRRYACATYRKTQSCPERNQHDADDLEARVLADLTAAFARPVEHVEHDHLSAMRAELDGVERRLAALPERFLTNMRRREAGTIASEAQLALMNQTLDAEQVTLTASRERLITELESAEAADLRARTRTRLGQMFAEDFEAMPMQQRKALLMEIIERVECLAHNPEPRVMLRAVSVPIVR